ncbi:hypothetical protein FZC33_15780 [Labrys sp. KNU-23]|uniref:hypothetical protein n=1 Tax=Labrys sp. KNU-23 TaxID=2789216 RepID=UPI0011EC19B5|nr:hypothetical protein [Labrys sp. KNU-23]QEN87687.1 hypothetical protein FZC33_15780 [Labrys sp. KNU-23]
MHAIESWFSAIARNASQAAACPEQASRAAPRTQAGQSDWFGNDPDRIDVAEVISRSIAPLSIASGISRQATAKARLQ